MFISNLGSSNFMLLSVFVCNGNAFSVSGFNSQEMFHSFLHGDFEFIFFKIFFLKKILYIKSRIYVLNFI